MRLGNATINFEEMRGEWKTKRLSPTLYLNKQEADTFIKIPGELIATVDGREIRRHAYLLDTTRSGTYKVVCNRILVITSENGRQYTTYWSDRKFEEIMKRFNIPR